MTITDSHRFNEARYKNWINDHVRFSDLDPLGHVNNNSIGQYFESARVSLFLIITPSWPHNNQIFILGNSNIDFRHELHMPAKLKVGNCITKIGRTSIKMANALFHENKGIAYCENTSVLIDIKTRKPVPIPDEMRSSLLKFIDGTL